VDISSQSDGPMDPGGPCNMMIKTHRLWPKDVCSKPTPEALLAPALACLQKLFAVQIPLPPISQPVSLFQVNNVYWGGNG